jgi:hypothetical protein
MTAKASRISFTQLCDIDAVLMALRFNHRLFRGIAMGKLAKIAAIISLLFCATAAQAGPYADELSKCLVKSTTADDQLAFIQWMFSAMSLHPAISNLSSITPDQRDGFNKKATALLVRLMAVDCRQQAVEALKYEGTTGARGSFQVLGQIAMRGLMANARVTEGMQALVGDFAHDERWLSLFREAGVSPTSPK